MNRYIQVWHLTQDTTWESDKNIENITYMRAKRLALFQQVITRLQWTDKKAWQKQILSTKEASPWKGQQKYFYWKAY